MDLPGEPCLGNGNPPRQPQPDLLLPLGGFGMGWLYHRFGGTAALGNNLVIDEVNNNRSKIPLRMAPLVLLGTIVTHLFGGSAGREGTAIQMGASLATACAAPSSSGRKTAASS